MTFRPTLRRSMPLAFALGLAVSLAGCGKKESAPPPAASTTATTEAPPAAAPAAPPAAAQPTAAQTPVAGSWSPESLEELLAPIALYPDPVLSQVLIASTNPQEVLDAGNWLLQNQNLSGKALDDAAAQVGFTPPIRALLLFPETLDMMCMELDWTTELGQAFQADQQGVLDAVQRLRRQAKDVGNLKSSPQMAVETEQQGGKEVVVLKPASETVYVPQYDPVAVYAPPPATAPTTVAPATTTTTTTTESTGHSTGTLVTTGLLAFGAGILVNELFDDDDHHHNNKYNDYYYPNYGYGGMPYYPPYPYRPAYGNGFYPGTGYNRPPNYQHGFNNNNVVVINNGQNGYWNDRRARATPYGGANTYRPNSPITAAKPNRPELQDLNKRQPRPMPADVKRPSVAAEPKQWKGQSSYAGAKNRDAVAARPTAGGGAGQPRPEPKVQGSYGGGDRNKMPQGSYAGAQKGKDKAGPQGGMQGMSRDMQGGARPDAGNAKGQGGGKGDRGYSTRDMDRAQPRPQPQQMPKPQQMDKASRPAPSQFDRQPQKGGGGGGGGNKAGRPSAMSGAGDNGHADRAASQRGRESMPQGARSKGGGGGGGGGGKKNKR